MGLFDWLTRRAPVPGQPALTVLWSTTAPSLPEVVDARMLAALGATAQVSGGTATVRKAGLPAVVVALGPAVVAERVDRRLAPATPLGEACLVVSSPDAAAPGVDRRTALDFLTHVGACLVARNGAGVVVHAAGEVVLPAAEWLRRVQAVGTPGFTPLLGWTDVGADTSCVFLRGLSVLGLPDVEAPAQLAGLSDDEAYERSHEAVLFAARAMATSGQALAEGASLEVPLGVEVGGTPLEDDNLELAEAPAVPWMVSRAGRRLRLEPAAPVPALSSLWIQSLRDGRPLAYPTYRRLLLSALQHSGLERLAFIRPPQLDGVPTHEVFVLAAKDAFVTVTCGLARVPQRGGEVAHDNAFVEFVTRLPEHSPRIASALSFLALAIHGKDADAPPVAPEHRVAIAPGAIAFPYAFMALAWSGHVALGDGPPVCLYVPVFMTQLERDTVGMDALPAWIEKNGALSQQRWLCPDVVVPLV